MESSSDNFELLCNSFRSIGDRLREELTARLDNWPANLSDPIIRRVVGSLLARQVYLSLNVIGNPGLWNSHTAPLLLRPVLESYLKIAWILQSPVSRSHGLARADLVGALNRVSQLKDASAKLTSQKKMEKFSAPTVKALQDELALYSDDHKPLMIESREMARKVGGKALETYRAYQVKLSSAVHSTWNHISRYNLTRDPNPLHRFQCIPMFPEIDFDFMHAVAAVDLCERTLGLLEVDQNDDPHLLMEQLLSDLEKIGAISRTQPVPTNDNKGK